MSSTRSSHPKEKDPLPSQMFYPWSRTAFASCRPGASTWSSMLPSYRPIVKTPYMVRISRNHHLTLSPEKKNTKLTGSYATMEHHKTTSSWSNGKDIRLKKTPGYPKLISPMPQKPSKNIKPSILWPFPPESESSLVSKLDYHIQLPFRYKNYLCILPPIATVRDLAGHVNHLHLRNTGHRALARWYCKIDYCPFHDTWTTCPVRTPTNRNSS